MTRGAAEWRTYWTHVQIIFKHWFHDEIRPCITIIIWLWFCVNFVLLLSVMNYCWSTFEIMTRIRQMAPLLYIINFSKLRFRVKDERTLISAKNRVDLSSISEVRSYNRVAPFYWPTLYMLYAFVQSFVCVCFVCLRLSEILPLCAPARHFFLLHLYSFPKISPCSPGSRWMAFGLRRSKVLA